MKKIFKRTIAITLVLCCILSAAGAFAPSYAVFTYIYETSTGMYYFSDDYYNCYGSVKSYQDLMVVQNALLNGIDPRREPLSGADITYEGPSSNPNPVVRTVDDDIVESLGQLLSVSKSATSKVSVKLNTRPTVFYATSLTQVIDSLQSIVENNRNYFLSLSYFEISLIDNITESVSYSDLYGMYGTPTIDLAGHTWTAGTSGYCLDTVGKGTSTVKLTSSKDGAKMVGGNGNSKRGGCIFVNNQPVSVENITFSNASKTVVYGGAIYVGGNGYSIAALTVDKCTFSGIEAGYGGVIYATTSNKGSVIVKNSTFTSCKSRTHGGAMYFENTIAVVNNVSFNSCSATNYGGAIYTYMGNSGTTSLSIDGSTKIESCTAVNGAGVYGYALQGNQKIVIKGNTLIQNCVATYGGGIYADSWATVTFSGNACIKSCTATSDGGGVYSMGTVVFSDNTFIKNCSANAKGSAAYVYNSSSVTFNNHSYADSCKGDAIYSYGGTIIINSDGEFPVNLAKASGNIAVYKGWFNKKVAYPASGKYATGAISGDAHKNAPYTVADKVVSATFYINDGTNTKTTYADMPAGSFTIPACNTAKTGYTFEGWRIGSPSGSLIQPGENLDLQNNTDFYGSWMPGSNAERTLTIKDPVSGDQYQIKKNSQTIQVESYSNKFKRANYYILSYNTEADGSGTTIPIGGSVNFGRTVSATIYVVWKETLNISEGTVNVLTFKDSYFNSKNTDFTFQSENSSIILMDNGFVRTGEVLAGWSTLPNGNGTVYQLGDRYTFESQNATLYAYWVSKSLNTYHAGESGKSQAQEIIIDIDPSASSGGAIEGKNGETITARTVIFYDPTGQNKAVTLKTYDSSTLLYAGGFRRSGYSLKGWNTQANGRGTDYVNGEEYTFKTDEKELNLYAMWTVNKNETIQGESGNGASQDIIDAYEKNGTLPDDWDPSSGSGGTIGNIPENWKEIYSDRPYYDVDSGKYYYDAVIWAEQVGAISSILGIDSSLFNGELPCTRADLVTLLWEVAGEPAPKKSKAVFDDVKDGMYYSKAVCWANEQGIILGVGDNKMNPDGIVTRAQAMTVLWRYHGSPAPSGNTSFGDVVKGSWYEKAVLWGYEKKITLGTGINTFSPDVTCSRGETVTFLFRDIVGIE